MIDLAIFGGKPLFTKELFVNRPNIGSRTEFLKLVDQVLDSRVFTNDGPFARKLEKEIAKYLNVKHCILTCNGTMALQLISKALNLQGEIILPSFTFIATAHAMQWQGLTPVFCDVDKVTNNIDAVACEKLISEKTTAILGVHLWGRPCDVEKLETIASEHNLKLFFDSAHAFGCSHNNKMIASFGNAEAFSFHSTKFFHTFEGGAVTTNDDFLADRIRSLRNFGFINYDCVDGIGVNAKMSEICAVMGLTNLEKIDEIIGKNFNIYKAYSAKINCINGLKVITYDELEKNNFQYIVVEVDKSKIGLSRDQLIKILQAENIVARRYFYPGCHLMEPYFSDKTNNINLPNTEFLADRLLLLPSGSDVSTIEVEKITNFLKKVIEHSVIIKKQLEIQFYFP
jgi:dTDP-4-amino-4,6-dideoxygalactose transaminase